MRTHLLSVLLGGVLVVCGYVLGSADPMRASHAGVASDATGSVVLTSGEYPNSVYVWHRDGTGVRRAERYAAREVGDPVVHVLERTEYVPAK